MQFKDICFFLVIGKIDNTKLQFNTKPTLSNDKFFIFKDPLIYIADL